MMMMMTMDCRKQTKKGKQGKEKETSDDYEILMKEHDEDGTKLCLIHGHLAWCARTAPGGRDGADWEPWSLVRSMSDDQRLYSCCGCWWCLTFLDMKKDVTVPKWRATGDGRLKRSRR
jgi:hypothetical protein